MKQYKSTLEIRDNRHSCAKLKTYHFSGEENYKFKDIDSLITAKTDYIHDLTLLKECLITLVKDAHLVVVKPGYINTYSSTAFSIAEISNTIENILINMQELCVLYYYRRSVII